MPPRTRLLISGFKYAMAIIWTRSVSSYQTVEKVTDGKAWLGEEDSRQFTSFQWAFRRWIEPFLLQTGKTKALRHSPTVAIQRAGPLAGYWSLASIMLAATSLQESNQQVRLTLYASTTSFTTYLDFEMCENDPTTGAHDYEVFKLPTPVSDSDIQMYRAVRLAALQTDPTFFLSTYEREVAFTDEVWRERLNGEGKPLSSLARESSGDRGGESAEEGLENSDTAPFVGTVTLVAGRALPVSMAPEFADRQTAYFMVRMWVAPEHRRMGLGRRLMERALAYAAEQKAHAG
ncbi:hypothetical protein BV20DRAFT_1114228 [Pilatotrama ljubarskyi]|nr:hypothetical protein BV20DRAFT_1114228 [Pilatotrama ljubarskyi]